MTSLRPAPFVTRVIVVLAALMLSLGLASTAQAHSVLLESTPADGAQLAVAPESVSLTFNEDITNLGTEIVVTVGDEELVVSEGAVEIAGPTIRQALAAERPEGAYKVTWRAVSADGHPISGVFHFTAADAVAPQTPTEGPDAPQTQEPETTDTSTGTGTQSATESPDAGDTDADNTDAGTDSDDTGAGLSASTWVIIGILIAAALILATMIGRALATSRRSK